MSGFTQGGMKTLSILMRTHSDYDDYSVEIVGVTDDTRLANAFLEAGAFDSYWSHEVEIVTLNVLQDFPAVIKQVNNWLDPKINPMCECGHRLLHHRRKDGQGSCKHNTHPIYEGPTPHKCKGFRLEEANRASS